jgi:hypothetical protein
MRRPFASISISRNMPAAALGLCLVPLVANAAAADSVAVPVVESNPASTQTIEVREGAEHAVTCAPDQACVENAGVATARTYLVETAHPGGTMVRQGPDIAIGRLHPEFAARLAEAIREAREAGLAEAGIFSAYRPPAFGVGGFSDKFNSLHAYGLAVDMHGIGRPGSSEAKLWHGIAAKHGVVCPYGVNNRAEWNHCQPTRVKVIRADNPLRRTIKAEGPPSPVNMFDAGKALIESVANLFTAFTGGPSTTEQDPRVYAHSSQRNRRVRTADAHSSRHQRQVRKGTKATRVAAHGRRASKHASGHRRSANVRRAARTASSQYN